MSNAFIVDVETKDKNNIIRRLSALKSTIAVVDGGAYCQDPLYSQVHIVSNLTEDQLDDWLYKNNFDYVGVVEGENTDLALSCKGE